MSQRKHITVLCGGESPEAEISRVTGSSVAEGLSRSFEVELVDLPTDALPAEPLTPGTVVFPAMHGPFGEDGQLQQLLESAGIAYAGCAPEASALCMDKVRSKEVVADCGFKRARDFRFLAQSKPLAEQIIESVGEQIVVKPSNMGSSVGVHMVDGLAELRTVLEELPDGQWMAEERIVGSEYTVGILEGEAMGIVEIRPIKGFYDLQNKYTPGATQYVFPAPIDETLACKVKKFAEHAFTACGCRDFARLDFIITSDERPYFLEINTLPGMTPTSLLPKSAFCVSLDFPNLVKRMVEPAFKRADNQSIAH